MSIDSILIMVIVTLFLIPLLVPKGKWFWVSSLMIFFTFVYLWADHLYYISHPDEHFNGVAAAIGEFIAKLVTGAFLFGFFIRLSILFIKKKFNEKQKNT